MPGRWNVQQPFCSAWRCYSGFSSLARPSSAMTPTTTCAGAASCGHPCRICLSFTWLPLTVLRPSDFVDQHFLFHVLLMPFTFGDLRLGAKLAAPLFSALAIDFHLRAAGQLSRPLPLAVAAPARRRLRALPLPHVHDARSQPRRSSFSAVGVYLILERKFVPLAILTFIFVWMYNMFPLIVVFALQPMPSRFGSPNAASLSARCTPQRSARPWASSSIPTSPRISF